MNQQVEKTYRVWLGLTAFFILLSITSVSAVLMSRAFQLDDERRELAFEVIKENFSNSLSQISQEIFLATGSLDKREELFQNILQDRAAISLEFTPSEYLSAEQRASLPDTVQWSHEESSDVYQIWTGLRFGDEILGRLELRMVWDPDHGKTTEAWFFRTSLSLLVTLLGVWVLVFFMIRWKVIRPLVESAERESEQAAFGKMARQLLHDIRTPLGVLKVSFQDLPSISGEVRHSIRMALLRLSDITGELQRVSRYVAGSGAVSEPEPIAVLVDDLVDEMLLLQGVHKKITFLRRLFDAGLSASAVVNRMEFKRAISNLLKNAVESIESNGVIEVSLFEKDEFLILKIKDNGVGMSGKILKKLGRGFSYGKPGGSGLGLAYVSDFVKSHRGELKINSLPGEGTTIELQLPRCSPPIWLATILELKEEAVVAVIDDDENVSSFWSERLKETGIVLRYFTSGRDFSKSFSREGERLADLYLFDCELLGENVTGPELIEELELYSKSVLVTGLWEDAQVREFCRVEGVKMLPKNLIRYVPIVSSV